MGKYKVNIITQSDLIDFVTLATQLGEDTVVRVLNEDNSFICNGKSLLGVRHAMEWDAIYIDAYNKKTLVNVDIYTKFKRFIIE